MIAAVNTPEQIVDALFWLLTDHPGETMFWNCAYWVPALLRRIERDPAVSEELIKALGVAPNTSAKVSLIALAGGSGNGRSKHSAFFTAEAARVTSAVAPPIGFDVTTGSQRIAAQILHELLT